MKMLDRNISTNAAVPPSLDPLSPMDKRSRVSFATSPDKTIDTIPLSPEPASPVQQVNEVTMLNHQQSDESEDDVVVRDSSRNKMHLASSNSKTTASSSTALRVNKILCRVPSHESNISDLSASLSPNYAHHSKNNNNSHSKQDENVITSILNACGVTEQITDLISHHQSMVTSQIESYMPSGDKSSVTMTTATGARKLDACSTTPNCSQAGGVGGYMRPAVWGMAPSDDEEDDTPPDVAFPTMGGRKVMDVI
eukprot:g12226.t1 g12226   contig6:1491167-1491925(+)